MWVPAERNFEKIQFEELRRQIDGVFNTAHDELSDSYYNYWRFGNSKPFRGFDAQSTLEESKILFDKLHGLIFHLRHLKFHQENLKQISSKQIPEEKYNIIFDKDGNPIGKKSDEILVIIQLLKDEGIELII